MGLFSQAVTGLYNTATGGRIHRLCRELSWNIDEVEGDLVKLYFNDSQAVDGIRKVCIGSGDSDLPHLFTVSHAILPENQVPEEVLGYLLTSNYGRTIGAWAVTVASAFGPLLSLRRAFEARGLPAPRVTLVSELVMFKLRVVAGSDLVGITVKANIDAAVTYPRLKILSVKGLDWIRPVAVAYRKDAYLSPAARRFIEILKAAAKGSSRAQAR